MPKVSVIIPVYGVEKYIERCARSLFEQTLDDIEYLFVDDCTPDRSIDILKQVLEDYPHRKAQVSIHRMEHNSGVAKVREWGMRHATGEYVIQCDSDDWVETDMYRTLYDTAVNHHSDIVICDFCKDKGSRSHKKSGCRTTDRDKLLENLIYKRSSWAVWNKLVKRSLLLPDIVYPADAMGDDMVIVLQLVCRARNISHVPLALYHYGINPASIIRTKTTEKCLSDCEQQKRNTDIVLKAIASHTDVHLKQGYEDFLHYLTSINMTPLAYHDSGCLKHWRELCPRLGLRFFLNANIAFRHKFKYVKLSVYWLFNSLQKSHG